ncbi:hypothetical protein MD484_g7475, partial [Candolleomyces efflorescens]
MKFSLSFVTAVVSVALCGTVLAAPALFGATDTEISPRNVAESMLENGVFARAPPRHHLIAVQEAQGRNKMRKVAKKAYNKANPDQPSRQDLKVGRKATWDANKKSPAAKAATKQAAATKRQQRKRTGAPSPGNQPKLPKNVKPTPQQKQDVRNHLEAARQKYEQTQGLPGRGQTVTVGLNSATGREARQSVFNSYVHKKSPIGRQRVPKRFGNHPYSNRHGDRRLRGQRPIPGGGRSFKEFPLIPNSATGWTGQGPVGALRSITYKKGYGAHKSRHAAFIGHDPNRRGTPGDHYLAQITSGKTDMGKFE